MGITHCHSSAITRCITGCTFALFLASSGWAQFVVTPTSPWIDPTSSYGAKCSGAPTDDTKAIQNALNAIPATGSALFIPPTATGCYIQGVEETIADARSASCSGTPSVCLATITFSVGYSGTLPANFPPQGGLINIHNVALGSNGTNFNGTFEILSYNGNAVTGASPCTPHTAAKLCISYDVGNSTTDIVASPGSNAVAEVGLYFNGNNLRIFGAAEGSNGQSPGGSLLTTNSAITILTTMTTAVPHTGPDVQNVTFEDTAGSAFAGLNIGNTNGFNVSNNGFEGFLGTGTAAAADPQGGAAIVTTGGQPFSLPSPGVPNPWVQFGKIENNHIEAKIGFASKFKVSSVTFDSNTVQCPSLGTNTPTQGMIGLDIGGVWYLNTGATSTGGENRVINQQTQGCLIGVLLGSQNNDRVEEKLENGSSPQCNGGTSVYCSIGMAVLNTQRSTLYQQSKFVATGLYLDTNSPNNSVYENGTGNPQSGQSSGGTLTTLCPAGSCPTSYSFTSASLVLDPVVAAGTAIFGTPSGGNFAPTSNSTFTTDNEASGLNVTVAGRNVAVAAHGDANNSDVFDAYANGSPKSPFFSVGSTGLPVVGNSGYVTGGTVVAMGMNYVLGDIVTITGGGGSGASFLVTTINGSGGVTGVSLLAGGTGYVATTGAGTSGGTGSGLTITTTVASTNGTITFNNAASLFTTTLQSGTPSANATVTLPSAAGTLATTLDTVGNLGATATNLFGSGFQWTLEGSVTAAASAVTITNAATGTNAASALTVSSTSSDAAQVPLIVNNAATAATGNIADFQASGVNKTTISPTGVVNAAGGYQVGGIATFGSLLSLLCNGMVSSGTTNYFFPYGQTLSCSAGTTKQAHIAAATFYPISIAVTTNAAPGTGITDTFELFDDNTSTSVISCAISGAVLTSCTGANSTNKVNAGDSYWVGVVTGSGSGDTTPRVDIQIR